MNFDMDMLSNLIIIILLLLIADKFKLIKSLTFIKKHKNMLYGLISGLILCKAIKYFRIEGFKIDIPDSDLERKTAAEFIDDLCNERNSDNATGGMLRNPDNTTGGMLRNPDNTTAGMLRTPRAGATRSMLTRSVQPVQPVQSVQSVQSVQPVQSVQSVQAGDTDNDGR